MSGVPQFMEGDPLENAERLLAGVMEGECPLGRGPAPRQFVSIGELADLEVALAEVRRAARRCDEAVAAARAMSRVAVR